MKRLAELKPEDFELHPVWEYFGTADPDAMVEPRSVASIGEADSAVLLAATEFHLADGTRTAGYCSPADDSGLDYMQPVVFIDDGQVPLWRPGLGVEAPSQICRELRKPIEDVFPIAWRCQIPVDGEVRAGDIAKTDVVAG